MHTLKDEGGHAINLVNALVSFDRWKYWEMIWLNRLQQLFRHRKFRSDVGVDVQTNIFPDYISCPYCGEPEIEVVDITVELRCYNCGKQIEYKPRDYSD